MKRIALAIAAITLWSLFAVAQKNGGSEPKPPVVYQTQQQIDNRIADVKQRTGKTLNLGKPVANPKRVRCYVLSKDDWKLAGFGDSEYGGTVCCRGRCR